MDMTEMNDKRFTRGEDSQSRTEQATPPGAYVLYLKLVSRYAAGVLTLGRYLTNPPEQPDYILRHHPCPRTPTQGKSGTASWVVTEITREEADRWERPARDYTSEHLIALSDTAGNVLLQHYGTEEKASLVEATLERALKERLRAHGDSFTGRCPSEIVDNYPLTTDELRVLARHHAEEHLKNSAWCVLMSSGGTTESWVAKHTTDRWNMAEAILGREEADAVWAEAEARVRKSLGEESWAAYQNGTSLWMDRLEEESSKELEPSEQQ
jgi:hypothetical protein